MICRTDRRHGLPVRVCWFAGQLRPRDSLGLRVYRQARDLGPVAGFRRTPFHTRVIDLAPGEAAWLEGFKPDTVYQLRRAVREGVACREEPVLARFAAFFDPFALRHGLDPLGPAQKTLIGSAGVVLAAWHEERPLAMHAYLVDPEASRARLLHAAAPYDLEEDAGARRLIGRAGRLLHLAAMRRFHAQGLALYDLGGYAAGTTDPDLAGINRLKDQFGGRALAEADYVAWPLALLQAARAGLGQRRERQE